MLSRYTSGLFQHPAITLSNLLRQSFSPSIIPAPTIMLSRYTSGLFQHPTITLSNLLGQSFSPSIIPAPTIMLSRYTSGLFQHPTITLSNLLGQSFSPSIIPAPSVIPANAGISLDIHSLPEGIYLLQIKDRNESLVKTEIIAIARYRFQLYTFD